MNVRQECEESKNRRKLVIHNDYILRRRMQCTINVQQGEDIQILEELRRQSSNYRVIFA